jgi:hypothetical protein
LRKHLNRFSDFKGSFDIIENTRSLGIQLLTFSFEGAINF